MRKVTVCTQYYSILVCGTVTEVIKAWSAQGQLEGGGCIVGLQIPINTPVFMSAFFVLCVL
jgi:hypothetical protein